MKKYNISNDSALEMTMYFQNIIRLRILAIKSGDINELKKIADDNFIYSNDQLSELETAFFDGIFDANP